MATVPNLAKLIKTRFIFEGKMNYWEINDPKTNLADIVEATEQNEAQIITLHGQEKAVVLSMSKYIQMKEAKSLSQFFRKSPLAESEIDLNYDRNK